MQIGECTTCGSDRYDAVFSTDIDGNHIVVCDECIRSLDISDYFSNDHIHHFSWCEYDVYDFFYGSHLCSCYTYSNIIGLVPQDYRPCVLDMIEDQIIDPLAAMLSYTMRRPA